MVKNELTKGFKGEVASFSRSALHTAEIAHRIGIYAVKAAYSGQNVAPACYALEELPRYAAKALAAWFRSAGLNVVDPLPGFSKYTVAGVVDPKRQDRVFKAIATRPVLLTEDKVVTAKKDKPLEGTPQERAQKAVDAMIKRLKDKGDDLAASVVSTRAGDPAKAHKQVLFNSEGYAVELDNATYAAILAVMEAHGHLLAA